MNTVVIMLKPVQVGKSRLKSFLKDEDRLTIIYSMLQDVLLAVCNASRVDSVWLVTKDRIAAEIASNYRVTVFDEGKIEGLNRAVERSASSCIERGVDQLLILPADIPLITSLDVDRLFLSNPDTNRFVRIVPSSDGSGTNALLLSPPDIITPSYGANSYNLHAKEAQKRGVPFHVVHSTRIAMDVDCLEDLIYVARFGAETKTAQYLWKRRLLEQLALYTRLNE